MTFGLISLPPCDLHVASGEAETNPQISSLGTFQRQRLQRGQRGAGAADASLKGPHHFLIQSRSWEQLSSYHVGGGSSGPEGAGRRQSLPSPGPAAFAAAARNRAGGR